ncbi:hypothetical protein BDV18DRAFT_132409 [Aspergillus unguis]
MILSSCNPDWSMVGIRLNPDIYSFSISKQPCNFDVPCTCCIVECTSSICVEPIYVTNC